MGEWSHCGEYPLSLDEWAGAVAEDAAEERTILGTPNDYNWLTETRMEQAIWVRFHCDHTFVSLGLDWPY
jgi:hypothetical protein